MRTSTRGPACARGYAAPLLAMLLLAACGHASPPPSGDRTSGAPASAAPAYGGSVPAAPNEPAAAAADTGPPPAPAVREALLLATGDIMVHSPQLPGYYDARTRKYDFTPWFRKVKPLLQQGDWVIGNLETPIAGADLKYTGYPRFNAPPELADALKDAGFGLVSTANNHAMDRGWPGIVQTLRHLRGAGLIPVGTADNAETARKPVLVERSGITLGFLAHTYGTNGIPIPADKPYAVNLIDLPAIAEDIRAAKAAGADLVVVSLHFGVEYERMPNEDQRRIARAVVASGADIVLGSHPHVVQPYETVEAADPNVPGATRRGLVIYSLGNFISNQTGDWKDAGLIFGVHIRKTSEANGATSVEWTAVEATPTWVRIERQPDGIRKYTVLPLAATVSARSEPGLRPADYDRLSHTLAGIEAHLRKLTPDKEP